MHKVIDKVRLTLFIAILILEGCASHPPLDDIPGRENADLRAERIFDTANNCWSEAPNLLLLKYGTAVDLHKTNGVSIIEGRWVSGGEYAGISSTRMPPFIVFVIKPTKSGSIVEIEEKDIPYIGKAKYREAAVQWAQGNYNCLK